MHTAISLDNRLVHIAATQRGAACQCRCLTCGEPVIAKKGEQREWHFSHCSGAPPCEVNPESLLHRFVKQTIAESASLMVPPLPAGRSLPSTLAAKCNGLWLTFDRVESEVAIGGLHADIVAFAGTDAIVIEVAYSSFCGAEKISALEQANLCALEIDVSGVDANQFDPESVRHRILTDLSIKSWLRTEPQVLAPSAGVSVDTTPAIREVLRVVIAGRVVRLSVLRWGQVVIAYDYGEMARDRIRAIGHRYQGHWDHRYKNWRFHKCWLEELKHALMTQHDPDSFQDPLITRTWPHAGNP